MPDLAFNEMRFLQKPKEHQDDTAFNGTRRQESKKERKRTKDTDISAYFSTKKVEDLGYPDVPKVLANADENDNGDQRRVQVHRNRRITPPIELPEKAFLGFGSKGVNADSRDAKKASTTYYTWSESQPRQQPLPPVPARSSSRKESGETEKHGVCKTEEVKNNVPIVSKERSPPRGLEQGQEGRRGGWISTRRARGPALAEIYQPPQPKENNGHLSTSRTRTTMQPLPGQVLRGLRERGESSELSFDGNHSEGYRTSDILKFHEPHNSSTSASQKPVMAFAAHVSSDKENHDPKSLTSVDQLLDNARHAMARMSNEMQSLKRIKAPAGQDVIDNAPLPTVRQMRERQFRASQSRAPVPEISPAAHRLYDPGFVPGKLSPPRPPSLSFHQYDSPQTYRRPGSFHVGKHGLVEVRHETAEVDDEEMLDNHAGSYIPESFATQTHQNEQDVEELVGRDERSWNLDCWDVGDTIQEQSLPCETPISLIQTPQIRGPSIELEDRSAYSIGAQSETSNGFAGFWKPNKLY